MRRGLARESGREPWSVSLTTQLLSSLTDSPRKEVYFMAIIDILTHYDAKKKAAHAAKTVKHGVSPALDPSCLSVLALSVGLPASFLPPTPLLLPSPWVLLAFLGSMFPA